MEARTVKCQPTGCASLLYFYYLLVFIIKIANLTVMNGYTFTQQFNNGFFITYSTQYCLSFITNAW